MQNDKEKGKLYDLIKEIVGKAVDQLREENRVAREEFSRKQMEQFLELSGGRLPQQAADPKAAGIKMSQLCRSLYHAKAEGGGRSAAMAFANKIGAKSVEKALAESSFTSGGALLPPDFANEIIPYLRAESVMLSAGVRVLPMPKGTMSIPKGTSGVTAEYVGAGAASAHSNPQTGQVVMNAKELAVTAAVSNNLMADGGPGVDEFLRDDISGAFAERTDAAIIRDDGTQNKPKGMRYLVASANVLTETNADGDPDGATSAERATDLGRAIMTLDTAKIPNRRRGWTMPPRTWSALFSAQTTTGAYIYRAEMENGMLLGIPFKKTPQIPTNLASPENGKSGELYLAEHSEILVGDTGEFTLDVFPGGAYYDGSAVQSGISLRQTVIAASLRHDVAARQGGNEIVVLLNSWGNP